MQYHAALTCRREQERILHQVCHAQLPLMLTFAGDGADRDEHPGQFVAFESDTLWLDVPRLLDNGVLLAGRRAELRFQSGAALRAVATIISRAPRLGAKSRPELLLSLRRPVRIEPDTGTRSFVLTAASLADVSAVLIDLDDARLIYSPQPLRITNRTVDLAIDPPEWFRGGDLFELQLAIPGYREQLRLYLRRSRFTTDGHGRSNMSFRILAGDEPRWTSRAVAALSAFVDQTGRTEPAAAVSNGIRHGGMPC